jgi:hypothetical protein
VPISYWPFGDDLLGLYLCVDGRAEIGLHHSLARRSLLRLRKVVVAHELAHHALHGGIYVVPFTCAPDRIGATRLETQAHRWAAERLVPVALVRDVVRGAGALGDEEQAELAHLCHVPPSFVTWWVHDLAARQVLPTGFVSPPPVWTPLHFAQADG